MAKDQDSELNGDRLRVSDGLELRLRVYRRSRLATRKPVLLLHGASAATQTFEFPYESSFVDYLLKNTKLEPWLLDWRCSKNVTEPYRTQQRFDKRFTYDHAAKIDIPAALHHIRAEYPNEPLRIVGHCMGAETLSRAIASGALRADLRPDRIVLSTIGLFYEVAVDGRLKADDHMLERLQARAERHLRQARDAGDDGDQREDFIDPTCEVNGELRNGWPEDLEEMYKAWPKWLRPHGQGGAAGNDSHAPEHILEMCSRVSFMFGEPYYEPTLHRDIHASPTELRHQFGMMPLRMYVHAAQCVRRGWAAPYDRPPTDRTLIDEAARKHFDKIEVLLVTGAMNRLWHRDSVDRMYEWLKRGDRPGGDRYRKIVFAKNGHQDLFWGANSWKEIFPKICDWLEA